MMKEVEIAKMKFLKKFPHCENLNHKAAGRPNEVKESLLNPIFGSGPWSNAGVTAAIAVVASAVAVATAVVVVATGITAATAPATVVVAVVGISSKFEGVQVPRSRLSRNARALTATTDRVHKLTLCLAISLGLRYSSSRSNRNSSSSSSSIVVVVVVVIVHGEKNDSIIRNYENDVNPVANRAKSSKTKMAPLKWREIDLWKLHLKIRLFLLAVEKNNHLETRLEQNKIKKIAASDSVGTLHRAVYNTEVSRSSASEVTVEVKNKTFVDIYKCHSLLGTDIDIFS
ncbi:hypothetical protein HZH68_012873 [Vespula germanica]|uniref:Uncharacterized protein n=1 Tax=Vespula germanica TaxID=30212 RepID=A0A834JKQ9_VESGE|nr:hypothetical protein HZH68_012873 [Vespula germanica]